ncbi:hypothetical protein CR513_12171, partial [Mucuna pruriens]
MGICVTLPLGLNSTYPCGLINVDRSWIHSIIVIGVGDLIRNNVGKCVVGFSRSCGVDNPLLTVILVVKEGSYKACTCISQYLRPDASRLDFGAISYLA